MSTRTSSISVRSTAATLLALLLVSTGAVVGAPQADAATPTSTVTGTVTLGGKPVSGATVTVYATEDGGRERYARVATKANGKFTAPFKTTKFELEQYHYWYEINDPTHQVISARRDFTPQLGKTVVKNAAVHSAGEITGYAKLPTGTDFSRLRVEVQGPRDGQANLGNDDEVRLVYPTTLTPRPSGFYRAWGLPPGEYHLKITDSTQEYQPRCHDGSVPVAETEVGYEECTTSPITISYGQDKKAPTQTLTTKSATISGHVADSDGKPVDLSRGYAVRADRQDGVSAFASSNSSGVYRFRGLPAGSWKISTILGSRYQDAYYGGDGTEADAEPVEVGPGAKATGVNIYVRNASRAYATVVPTTGGATFTVAVKKVVDGSPVQGPVVLVLGSERRTVDLNSKGRAKATVTGLPKGKTVWKVAFLGTEDTGTSRLLGSVKVP